MEQTLEPQPKHIDGDYLKSQKAKGVFKLAHSNPSSQYLSNVTARRATFWNPSCDPTPPANFPFFARPCPMRPRHGFLDSRPIKSQEEWDALRAEIVECDEPECEVIIMPVIPGAYSGILTPSGVAIGPGHEGATSGQDSYGIPAPSKEGSLYSYLGSSSFYGKEIFGVEDTPYIEWVRGVETNDESLSGYYFSTVRPEVVQVRDGPSVGLTDRYVPETITVEHVVKAEGDLVKWETTAKNFLPGTVVWHPGGNLSSHYAVHSILNGVPVLCIDQKPTIGEVIEKTEGPSKLKKIHYKKLASLVRNYIPHVIEEAYKILHDDDATYSSGTQSLQEKLRVAIATLHAGATWGNEPHLLRLRAHAAATMAVYGTIACIGENRHKQYDSLGQHFPNNKVPSGNRLSVYQELIDRDLTKNVELLRLSYLDFKKTGWSSSFGGKKWAQCSRATMLLWKSMCVFNRYPNKTNWNKIMERMNKVVHVSHNGGYFLNKFVSNNVFDVMASVPALGYMNDTAWEIIDSTDALFSTNSVSQSVFDTIEEAVTLQKKKTDYPTFLKVALGIATEDESELVTGVVTTPKPEPVSAFFEPEPEPEPETKKRVKKFSSLSSVEVGCVPGGMKFVDMGDGFTLKLQLHCKPFNRPYGISAAVQVKKNIATKLLGHMHPSAMGIKSKVSGDTYGSIRAEFFDDLECVQLSLLGAYKKVLTSYVLTYEQLENGMKSVGN